MEDQILCFILLTGSIILNWETIVGKKEDAEIKEK
jgi:hypothetical protein